MNPIHLAAVSLALIACGPDIRPDQGSGVDAAVQGDAPALEADAAPWPDAASCEPCAVSGSGTFCGVQVQIAPYATGGPFGGFQSTPGTGESALITISLQPAINWVSVKVIDPDFAGNYVRAYDANNQLVSELMINFDGVANVLTEEMGGTGGAGIVRVDLVPAPADYVAYDQLRVVPAGCAPIL